MADCPPVIGRLCAAWNAHDVAALMACLHSDYASTQPLHPERNLQGRPAALQSWRAVFASIPDVHAELRAYAALDDTVWTEWRWHGTHRDGAEYNAGGVIIYDLENGLIARARIYTEVLSANGPDFDRLLEDILGRAA